VSLLILVQAQLKAKLCSDNDEDRTDSFATAIMSLFEKLLIGKAPTVDLLFDNSWGWECQQEYILENVMEKNRGKFAMRKILALYAYDNNPVLFIASCQQIFKPKESYPQPFVFYCPNMNAEDLHNQVVIRRDDRLTGRNMKFLVKGGDNFIDLMSFAHFTADQSSCRKPQFVQTNRFMINESRWLSTEFQTEPARNFHGCELIIGVSQLPPHYNYIEHDNGSLEASGFYIEVIKATAKMFNFSLYFNADGAMHKENNKYQFDEEDEHLLRARDVKRSTQFLYYNNWMFLIPLGELYSDAAKLFMPLELEVWIAAIVTILIALLVIQIINRMSQQVQNLVYGRNVTTPTLNIMIAFVGGGQMRLPDKNFARFLLMLFIMFSLIIRTCHQSKYFEYLQADFIKHEIQTSDELIERNYTIYVPLDFEKLGNIQRFRNVKTYHLGERLKLYEETVEVGFEGAVLIMDKYLIDIESKFKTGKTSLKALKEIELGAVAYFPLNYESLIREQVEDTIGRLHSAGLIDFWYKKYFPNINKLEEESEPTPLTMDHLTVGFVVSLNLYLAAQSLECILNFL